jgi:hypothetical protein
MERFCRIFMVISWMQQSLTAKGAKDAKESGSEKSKNHHGLAPFALPCELCGEI